MVFADDRFIAAYAEPDGDGVKATLILEGASPIVLTGQAADSLMRRLDIHPANQPPEESAPDALAAGK